MARRSRSLLRAIAGPHRKHETSVGRPRDAQRVQQDSNLRPTAPEAGEICKNVEKNGGHDGAVTAIVDALTLAGRRDPDALRVCVEALGMALGALLAQTEE